VYSRLFGITTHSVALIFNLIVSFLIESLMLFFAGNDSIGHSLNYQNEYDTVEDENLEPEFAGTGRRTTPIFGFNPNENAGENGVRKKVSGLIIKGVRKKVSNGFKKVVSKFFPDKKKVSKKGVNPDKTTEKKRGVKKQRKGVSRNTNLGVSEKKRKGVVYVEEIPLEIKTKLRKFFTEKGVSDDTILYLYDEILGRNIKRIAILTSEILNWDKPVNREYVRRVLKRERGV